VISCVEKYTYNFPENPLMDNFYTKLLVYSGRKHDKQLWLRKTMSVLSVPPEVAEVG
jgi:hypothetical protein